MDGTNHEAEILVEATPEEVWDALTNPEKTRGYYYGTDILSDWQPGSRWTSESGDELYLEGELIEVDPPRRIVQTFHVAIEEPAASDPPSRVTWEVTPVDAGHDPRADDPRGHGPGHARLRRWRLGAHPRRPQARRRGRDRRVAAVAAKA